MAHQNERARPRVKEVLQHGEHVRVEVVSGLVQDEHVGLAEKDAQYRQAPPLAAGQVLYERRELPALEAQALQQLLRALRLAVHHVVLLERGQKLLHAPVVLLAQLVQVLRKDAELHGLADLHVAGARQHAARHHLQERGLAGAVLAQDAVAVARPYEPVHVAQHLAVAVAGAHVLKLHHLLAQAAHGKALQLRGVAQRRVVRQKRHRGVDPELRLARARLRAVREPVELLAQGVLAALLRHGRLALALHALLDVRGVATLERVDDPVVHLPHVLAHLVQEPAVVRHDEKGALPLLPAVPQVARKPRDRAHVQVVRGLVHQDHVPRAHEHARKVAASALPARELAHPCVPVHVAQKLVHDGAHLGV